YSFGAMMYQMLTGKHPFYGAVTIFEFMNKHVNVPVPPLSQANERIAVPWQIEAVIMTALEKEPDRRYQSARQMQAAIVDACSGQLARESREHLYLLAQQARNKSPSGTWAVSDVESDLGRPLADYFEKALDPMREQQLVELQPEATPDRSLLSEARDAQAAVEARDAQAAAAAPAP